VQCRRYFQKSYPYATAPGTPTGSPGTARVRQNVAANYAEVTVMLGQMCATPTIKTYDELGASGKVSAYNGTAWINGVAISAGASETGFTAEGTNTGSWAVLSFDYTADARL
jgi:hypothetical protein